MNNDFTILKRLYKDYTRKYFKKILLSVFFAIFLAASTSSIAYLLDPAIKQLFIEQEKTLLYVIPGLIILAFAVKGSSLYVAKVIMISVGEEVRKDMQVDMFGSLIVADTKLIDNKQNAGFKSIQWDATNNYGKRVSAGVYLYKIKAVVLQKIRRLELQVLLH